MEKIPLRFPLYKRGSELCLPFYPVCPLTLTLSRRAREYYASLVREVARSAGGFFDTLQSHRHRTMSS